MSQAFHLFSLVAQTVVIPQTICYPACTYCNTLSITNDIEGRTSVSIDEVRDDVRLN
jgi:hypothetical protein